MTPLEKVAMFRELQDELKEFAEKYILKFECHSDNFQQIDSVEIEKDVIEVQYEEYYSGCCSSYENQYVSIPLNYFTELHEFDAWEEVEQEKRDARNLVALKERAAKKKVDDQQKKEAEYKHYLELNEKFSA